LPEILALSDRILVARQGRIVEEMDIAEATETKIMCAAVYRVRGRHASSAVGMEHIPIKFIGMCSRSICYRMSFSENRLPLFRNML
jgi:hypothetical protein